MGGVSGSTECIECAAGRWVDSDGSDHVSDCILCAAGRYVASSGSTAAGDCIECGAGKYVDVEGSDAESDCILCMAGKYVETSGNVAGSACIDCPSDSYVDVRGSDLASDCIACPSGSSTGGATGQWLASQCDLAHGTLSCACNECSAGQFTATVGDATSCTSCAAGQSQPLSGQTVCVACGSVSAPAERDVMYRVWGWQVRRCDELVSRE